MGMFGGLAETLHQSTGIDPEYRRCGMLVLQPVDMKAALNWCAAHGMEAEEQDGGVFLPEVAQARNPRLLQSLRARVEKLGGRIIEQCEVKQIVAETGKVKHLATTRGNFSADAYVVTAGAWSKVLLGEHALKTDIKPIRGQMLLFKFDAPPLPHIVLQGDIYLIPRRDGHLLLGSTREDVGFDKSTTDDVRAMLLQRGIALLPALRDMPIIMHWAGLRPASPGNIPTIGRHPQLANLFINSGHFRYGVTMSPAAVEVLLNTMDNLPQPFDVSPYLWR
jgi:glycine oxidase